MRNQVKNKIFGSSSEDQYSKTYSQSGEDSIVAFIANGLGIYPPSYIDIGAYDPFSMSNTARFYMDGARGLNIEPNPEVFPRLASARNEDVNLNIGIAPQSGVLTYYMMDAPTLNTFSEAEAMKNVEQWGRKIVTRLEIPVDTIDNVVNTHCNGCYPDFLNLDVEDGEIPILKTICASPCKPKILCIETLVYGEKGHHIVKRDVIDFVCSFGYFQYATTYLNTVFVLNDLWENR